MVKFFKNLFNKNKLNRDQYTISQELKTEPWACFEIVGFEKDGRIKVMFNWNKAFIEKINTLGFQAETEEDSVQLFFYTSQMKPTEMHFGDDAVQPENTPLLSQQQNIFT
jgi:hypothetical protein